VDTAALPVWDEEDEAEQSEGVLTVAHTTGTSSGAISLHPSSREGHLPPEAAETSLCFSVSIQAWRHHQAEAVPLSSSGTPYLKPKCGA